MHQRDVIYAFCRIMAKSFSLHEHLAYRTKRCGGNGFVECDMDAETNVEDKCEYLSDNYLDSIVIASYICNPLRKRRIVLRKANTKF